MNTVDSFIRDIQEDLDRSSADPPRTIQAEAVTGNSFYMVLNYASIIFRSHPDIFEFPLYPCLGEDVFKGFLETEEIQILEDSVGHIFSPNGLPFYGDKLINPRAYWALQLVKHTIKTLNLSRVM